MSRNRNDAKHKAVTLQPARRANLTPAEMLMLTIVCARMSLLCKPVVLCHFQRLIDTMNKSQKDCESLLRCLKEIQCYFIVTVTVAVLGPGEVCV